MPINSPNQRALIKHSHVYKSTSLLICMPSIQNEGKHMLLLLPTKYHIIFQLHWHIWQINGLISASKKYPVQKWHHEKRVKRCQDDHYGEAQGWHRAGSAVLALALRSGTPAGPIGTDVRELAGRCTSHLLLLLQSLFIHFFSPSYR